MFEEQVEDILELHQKFDKLKKKIDGVAGSSSSSDAQTPAFKPLKKTQGAKKILTPSDKPSQSQSMNESSSVDSHLFSDTEKHESSEAEITITSK